MTWEEATREFVDQTGRPGPATWQAGDYAKGQDDYPVCGISWHEAAAYAEFMGKSLPTAYHWDIARGQYAPQFFGSYSLMASMSNFKGEGPAPIGSYPGMTPYGAYDMAGNVREWCWNESGRGRVIKGGAWNDTPYMFTLASQASPFDRDPQNGFRCVLYLDAGKIPKSLFALVKSEAAEDFKKGKPVSDSVFQVYREQYFYDKTNLHDRIEWRNADSPDWIQEKITFDAAYENERVMAYLFLPKRSSPPFQTVIYFPGIPAVIQRSSTEIDKCWEYERYLSFMPKNGRAVLFPVYKGTFERGGDTYIGLQLVTTSHQYSDYFIKVVKDFRKCVDYLETRPDIDSKRLAYFGFSLGGQYGSIIPAVEDRVKASVLVVGGFWGNKRSEVTEINYVT